MPLQRSSPSGTGDTRPSVASPAQTVAILPPALKALVILWEQLSTNCLHAISNQTALPSPNPSSSTPTRSLNRLKQKEKVVSFKDPDANKVGIYSAHCILYLYTGTLINLGQNKQ